MNHNPFPIDQVNIRVLRVVSVSEVLDTIGHPDLHETDCFDSITFGDAAHTLCSGWRLFDMIDRHLESEDDGMGGLTYTGEQSDRIRDFLHWLANSGIFIDMEE